MKWFNVFVLIGIVNLSVYSAEISYILNKDDIQKQRKRTSLTLNNRTNPSTGENEVWVTEFDNDGHKDVFKVGSTSENCLFDILPKFHETFKDSRFEDENSALEFKLTQYKGVKSCEEFQKHIFLQFDYKKLAELCAKEHRELKADKLTCEENLNRVFSLEIFQSNKELYEFMMEESPSNTGEVNSVILK